MYAAQCKLCPKKKKIMKSLLAFFLLTMLSLHKITKATSIVYNFRVAQVTGQPIIEQTHKKSYASSSPLVFNYFQKSQGFNIRENYTGGLATFYYNFASKYYLRADLAVAHANQKIDNLQTVDVTEPDDILLTLSRKITTIKSSHVAVSGMFGIPTHPVYTLQRIGFGPGQVGIGTQLDGRHALNKYVDLIWGGRYNYFIPRTAFDILDKPYKFTVGSIADLLVALRSSYRFLHGFEGGYDARWGFGPRACPVIANINLLNYMRNSFYLVYKYTLLTKRATHRILLNISYGFDVKPKLYGYNAVMVFGSWGVAF